MMIELIIACKSVNGITKRCETFDVINTEVIKLPTIWKRIRKREYYFYPSQYTRGPM